MCASTTSTTVKLDSLTKHFRDITAVGGVNLSVRDGELLTLLGPSGCGKTTTLRMIAGFENPNGGSIQINGRDVTKLSPYNRDTGMVFQHYALFPHMTVADNIAFGLKMENVSDTEANERVEEALMQVQLPGVGDRYPSELSGGQQQRIALARALVIQPSVLLLDEPLSDLDKKLREEMRLEISRLHHEFDITMVYVTHNQEEALTISDRMAVMNEGEIHQVGTPEEIYQEPADRFVADFIGGANLLTGTVKNIGKEEYTVKMDNEVLLTLGLETARQIDLENGKALTLLFRPEKFQIRHENDGEDYVNVIQGGIREITYLGSEIEYFVEVGNNTIYITQSTLDQRNSFEEGDVVNLTFDSTTPFAITGEKK